MWYAISYIGVVLVASFLITTSRPRRRWGDVFRSLLDPTFHLLGFTSYAALAAPLVEYAIFRWPQPLVLNVVGGALIILSGMISFEANRTLGRSFTPYVDADATRKPIVRAGMYRYIRHPLYSAGFLLMAAAPLMLAGRFSWFFSAFCWLAILIRTLREERLLRRNMEGYAAYMRETKRYIPWVI